MNIQILTGLIDTYLKQGRTPEQIKRIPDVSGYLEDSQIDTIINNLQGTPIIIPNEPKQEEPPEDIKEEINEIESYEPIEEQEKEKPKNQYEKYPVLAIRIPIPERKRLRTYAELTHNKIPFVVRNAIQDYINQNYKRVLHPAMWNLIEPEVVT